MMKERIRGAGLAGRLSSPVLPSYSALQVRESTGEIAKSPNTFGVYRLHSLGLGQNEVAHPFMGKPAMACLMGACEVDKSRPYALESANQFVASILETSQRAVYSSLRRKKSTHPNFEARDTRTQLPPRDKASVCMGASTLLICDGVGVPTVPLNPTLRAKRARQNPKMREGVGY